MRKPADESRLYNIGSNIRAARKRADMTQEELSEKIGVTPQYLSDLERGLVGTSVSTLSKVCSKLNVSADFILFGNNNAGEPNLTLIEKIQRLPKDQAELIERSVDLMLEAIKLDPHE